MAAFRKYTHQEMVKEEESIPFLVKDKMTECIKMLGSLSHFQKKVEAD